MYMNQNQYTQLLLVIIAVAAILLAMIFMWTSTPAHAWEMEEDLPIEKHNVIFEVTEKLPHHNFKITPKSGRFRCGKRKEENAHGCYTRRYYKNRKKDKVTHEIEINISLNTEEFRNVLLHEIGHYYFNFTTRDIIQREELAWDFRYNYERYRNMKILIDSNRQLTATDVRHMFWYFYGWNATKAEIWYWSDNHIQSRELYKALRKNAWQFRETGFKKDYLLWQHDLNV